MGTSQLDEAVLLLSTAIISTVRKYLPIPGAHTLTEGMLPVGAKRRGVQPPPASTSSPVLDIVSEDDGPAAKPPDLQCPRCGPGTGWTCIDSQTLGMSCAACSTSPLPTGGARFHCLCCNDYFCPTCAPLTSTDATIHSGSLPGSLTTSGVVVTAKVTPPLPLLRCPYCGIQSGGTIEASHSAWRCHYFNSTCGNMGESGTPRLHCTSCDRSYCTPCSNDDPVLRRKALDADRASKPQSHAQTPRAVISCPVRKYLSFDSPSWSCVQCTSRKPPRKQSLPPPEPNNDLKNPMRKDTPSPAPVVDSSSSITSSPTSTPSREGARDKFTSPRPTTCKACPAILTPMSHPHDSKWQCEECRTKKRASHRTGGISQTCPTCGTHWCAACAPNRSQSDSLPPPQRTADHPGHATPDDQEYLVEKVETHRFQKGRSKAKGQLQFLIKWSGYDASQNTWEPWENLLDNVIVHVYVRGHGMAHLIDSEPHAPDSLTSVLSGANDGPRTEPPPADSSSLPPALSATTTVAPLLTSPAAESAPQGEGASHG